MIDKLNIVKQRYDEVNDLIIQPDIISDQKRYVELTKEYKDLKEKRCEIFLNPLRKIIPDIDKRIEIKMLGTPLTHQKFTYTSSGSYGPAISAKQGLFPGYKTPIKNVFSCGASTFPGIGIPAVAASGAYAAEGILGKREFKKLISIL